MNKMKNFWNELTLIEKLAEIIAFCLLVVYIYFISTGRGAAMLFVLGLILCFNGLGCIKRNPSNCRISVLCGIIVIFISVI